MPDTLILLFQAALQVQQNLGASQPGYPQFEKLYPIYLFFSKHKPHNVKLNKILLIEVKKYMSASVRIQVENFCLNRRYTSWLDMIPLAGQ